MFAASLRRRPLIKCGIGSHSFKSECDVVSAIVVHASARARVCHCVYGSVQESIYHLCGGSFICRRSSHPVRSFIAMTKEFIEDTAMPSRMQFSQLPFRRGNCMAYDGVWRLSGRWLRWERRMDRDRHTYAGQMDERIIAHYS